MGTRKIVVLGTGGTIAGTAASASEHVGYRSAQVGVAHLLAGISTLAHVPVETEQVAQVDSKSMTFAIWRDLALRSEAHLARDDVQGIVITHGTDTLEETAFFLQSVLQPAKPVVITCAMRPSTALVPDGPQNLVDAFTVALSEGAQGVVAVCAGVIHGASEVTKAHPFRLDAFSSGDVGPLGHVEDGALRMGRGWPGQGARIEASTLPQASQWPRVEIVLNHAGASGAIVDALVAQGVQGVVVAGTGNGTVHEALEESLLRAQSQGVRVVRSTRCAEGRVIVHASDKLRASPLSPVKARIALMLEMMA